MVAQPAAVPRLPALLVRYRTGVDKGLREALAVSLGGLERLFHYHMGWTDPSGKPMEDSGGKAVRPALCLWACEGLGGEAATAMPAAAAVELVHNFSLIHDDIQDGDRERRNRPTVWALWGKPQGIVAGNALRALADQALLGLVQRGVPPSRVLGASAILTGRYLEMIEGQYLDLSYEGRVDLTVQDYLEMVGKKTGALMEAALHLGAYLGSRDPRQVEALRRCGRLLGLAFQARDDVLGLWGEEALTGKATGADIRRRKTSLPILYALQAGGKAERARLTFYYARRDQINRERVAEVLALLESTGARAFAQRMAKEKAAEALAWAREASLSPGTMQELEELTEFIIHREH